MKTQKQIKERIQEVIKTAEEMNMRQDQYLAGFNSALRWVLED